MEFVPEELWFRDRLAEIEPELDSFAAACAQPNPPPINRQALAAEILDGPRDAWVVHLRTALRSGVDLMSVVDALVLAASERLLRFDVMVDSDPTVQEGWLHITHRLTFAQAIRTALCRPHHANLLRLLFHSAHFTHSAAPVDLAPADRMPRNTAASSDPEGDIKRLVSAIRRHDATSAVTLAEGLLAASEQRANDDSSLDPGDRGVDTRPAADADARNSGAQSDQHAASITAGSNPQDNPPEALRGAFEAALEALALDDIAIRPIFKAHWIKLCVAAFAEARALPPEVDRRLPLLACVRFFAGPQRELRLSGLVFDAIRFVVDHKVPKTLT